MVLLFSTYQGCCYWGNEASLAPDNDASEGSKLTVKLIECVPVLESSLSMPCQSLNSGSCQYENYAISDLSIQGYTEDDG